MARQLWLLRHADAEPHGTRPDDQRALTQRGERQARIAGRALGRMQARFEAALVSPKVRAAQTAALAAEVAGQALDVELRTHSPLASGYDASQALSDLREVSASGNLLLVGHQPDMGRVIGDLTGAVVDLKKGGLAVVRLHGVGGELLVLLRPRELALIVGELVADV